MFKRFGSENFFIDVFFEDHSAYIAGGMMGDFEVISSPLFEADIKNMSGEKLHISSENGWEKVTLRACGKYTEISFLGYENAKELCILLEVREETDALVWRVKVLNDSTEWSVMTINYPTPVLKNSAFDLFIPQFGGSTACDAANKGFSIKTTYPGELTMQYFAAYSKSFGVYLGAEDESGAVKYYSANAADGVFSLEVAFYAIGGGVAGNSFDARGDMRWQGFVGDWYDASMIYADFVYKKAQWLPEQGRPDTPEKFKNIPFWVCDYIPNTASQGNNKPMLLSAGSDIYEPEYWYKAPLQLQEELGGIPIA